MDGTERIEHETGRPRTAFFYWLGSKTTKKQQGLCAMALRNLDKERHPHERIMQVILHNIYYHYHFFLINDKR